MLHIKSLPEGAEIFKALGSDIRIEIVQLLLENGGMTMTELAKHLGITNGALTAHMKKLEECGIVQVSGETAGHGNQKICTVHLDKILIDVAPQEKSKDAYDSVIRVGQYTDYNVYPTCGIADSTHLIGEVDDARYFAHPDRYNADILWFTKGYVEYVIPNLVPAGQKMDEITLSAELSSEAPGINSQWPSDIHFSINNVELGTWISPGDFGDVPGIFTPDWWFPNWNQYGLLKMIVLNHQGTFIDGLKISDVSIDQFKFTATSPIRFRMAVPEDTEHVGGLTIFGKNFGNYRQDINVRVAYSPINPEAEDAQ